MSENSREQISALVDEELETGSVFILNAMKDNQEYRQAWSHYHLIGEALRGNLPEQVDMNLAERVSKALQNEPAYTETRKSFLLLKPLAGFAIAASVTVVAILGVRQAGIEPAGSPSPVVASNGIEAPVHVVSSDPVPATENRVHEYTVPADAESRLNRYLVNHNEYRNTVGVQGMLPYVRIVAHEVEE